MLDDSFSKLMPEYRKQLDVGTVKTAYQGLMEYFDTLRLHLKTKYPDYSYQRSTTDAWITLISTSSQKQYNSKN